MRALWFIATSAILAAALVRADARQQLAAEPRVTLELKDQPVAEALRALFQAAKTEYRLALSPIPGRVTVSIRDVPLTTSLRIILRQAGVPLTFRSEGTIVVIESPPPQAAPAAWAAPSITIAPPATPHARPVATSRRRLSPPFPQVERWYAGLTGEVRTVAGAAGAGEHVAEVMRRGARVCWVPQSLSLPDGRTHMDGISANEKDRALSVVLEELLVYPRPFLKQLHLIVVISGPVYTQNGRRTGSGSGNLLILNGNEWQPPLSIAKTLHHELLHVLDHLAYGELQRRWANLSPAGRRYTGRFDREGHLLEDNIPGFVSAYATANEREDRAETFAAMILDLRGVEALAAKDRCVAEKVACIREFLAEVCPEIDSLFWDERRRQSRSLSRSPGGRLPQRGGPAPPDNLEGGTQAPGRESGGVTCPPLPHCA